MRTLFSASLVSVLGSFAIACGGADAPTSESGVYGTDDSNVLGDDGEDGLSAEEKSVTDPGEGENGEDQAAIGDVFRDGARVETTANLNLRSGPATDRSVLRTIPNGSEVTVVDGTPQNGFVKISQNGLEGFSAYRYLQGAAGGSSPSTGGGPAPSGSRAAAIGVASSQVGLSYWWGHGRFVEGAVTSSNRGRCSGSCPSCSHSGAQNGADCSGFVAKVWGVPSSNTNLTSDNHPYSTSDFYGTTGSGKWGTVSKSALQPGDAMVYRAGSRGHVFLYEKGDAWGQPWAYEAKGCSYGVTHGVRSAGGSYKAIKRVGF